MKIFFSNAKLEAQCGELKKLSKALGAIRAKLLLRRLDDLRAADNLEIPLAGRPHALVGDRAGQFSIDLDGPYRLIFEPCDTPPALLANGGIDRRNVKEILIIEIVDTHDK